MVFLVVGWAATPFLSGFAFALVLACGLTAVVLATGLPFALAALTGTGLATTLAAGFLLTRGLATTCPLTGNLAALAGSFTGTLAGVFVAVFTTAFALTATFDAAFAGVFNFFSCAFTVCLLWKLPLDKRLSEQQQRNADAAQTMRETMRGKCQSMSRQIETAVDNVGRIITDLRPSILDHQGLWAALDWQAHEFVQSAELQLDWQMNVCQDLLQAAPIGEQAAIGIFRIFQEMLSNVGRHAHASRVAIAIEANLEAINITVQDDGCGADPAAFEAANAYGVMGMRERARHLGGNIQISSQIGLGSTFHLCIQLLK